jgi:hypothetical protein
METVSRTLSRLEKTATIEVSSLRRIVLRDQSALSRPIHKEVRRVPRQKLAATRFDLGINGKTAKAPGLVLPVKALAAPRRQVDMLFCCGA